MDLLRSFNQLSNQHVRYKPLHNQLSKPALAELMKVIADKVFSCWINNVLEYKKGHFLTFKLTRARRIALDNGEHYAYTGNVHDEDGESTYCHQCNTRLIGRDRYVLSDWNLDDKECCKNCGAHCPGVLKWGARRLPVQLSSFA